MNDFTASNGRVITTGHGKTNITREDGFSYVTGWDYLDDQDMDALREFFQAEADERLGRWRSRFHPEYFVVPSDQFREGQGQGLVLIVHEPSAFVREAARSTPLRDVDSMWPDMDFGAVAAKFFDAHPEPKPWHEAQPGEVWVLETHSDLGTDRRAWHITDRPESFWALSQGYLLVKSKSIVSGYRIWPEVPS